MKLGFNINKIVIGQRPLIHYFVLIIYKLTLDLIYMKIVFPVYEYAGMFGHFSIYKYIISTLLFILMLKPIIGLYKYSNFSSLLVILLNLLYFVPGYSFYALAGLPDMYFIFFSLYWFALILFFYSIHLPKFQSLNHRTSQLFLLSSLFVIILAGLFMSGLYNGFRLHFSFSDVYELRTAQRLMDLPTFVRYFQPIAATLAPIAMVYCFVHRQRLLGLALLIVQLLSFGFGGAKVTIVSLIVAIFAYLFYNEKRITWIASGFIMLNLAAIVEFFTRGVTSIGALIHYRVIFIPNLLSFQYYDYFKMNELLFWRESILRRLGFDTHYTLPIPNLIGKVYYADVNNSANNGLVGDAFSNFGWAGFIILPFIIIIFSKIADACTNNLDIRIIITAAVICAIGFTNSSFFVLMLSNGFIFACILLYSLPRQKMILLQREI